MINNTLKQKALLEQRRKIFSSSDLATLWGITNRNTLLTTISRYIKREILYRIYKGLYSTTPIEKVDKYELACSIAGNFSYISTETVLQNEGLIMQSINKITVLGEKAKSITVGDTEYLCRRLNPKFLYNRAGIDDNETHSIASKDRAILDMLHISPNYYFDNFYVEDNNSLDNLKEQIGYK